MLRALIFDVDGTLVDTEREGHLRACNDAFARLGVPVRWTWEEFYGMLPIPGNALRMRTALQRLDPSLLPTDLETLVSELIALKQRLYLEVYLPGLSLRPGVRELVSEAIERNVRLAIVSTSDEPQISALLEHHLPEAVPYFAPVLGKAAGTKTAPGAPLHRRCLAELGTSPGETLMIEDSELGLRAARAADLPCAVIYNDATFGEDFTGARLVASSLAPFDLDRLAALALPDGMEAALQASA